MHQCPAPAAVGAGTGRARRGRPGLSDPSLYGGIVGSELTGKLVFLDGFCEVFTGFVVTCLPFECQTDLSADGFGVTIDGSRGGFRPAGAGFTAVLDQPDRLGKR